MAGTLRTRFALLYAGAFAVTGLVVLAAASLTVKSTVHAGSSGRRSSRARTRTPSARSR